MKTTSRMALSVLLLLALALPGLAQGEVENSAYRTYYGEQNAQKKIELGEKFLTDFKESTYRAPVLQGILNLYVQGQNWAKVMEHGDKLPAELPNADAKIKTTVYTLAMGAAQAANNANKTIEFGDKVLAADPNDLQAQVIVSTTIPVAMPQDKAANDKAIGLATKALAGVAQYFSAAKPANLTDAQWRQARAEYDEQLHSTLGLIYFSRVDYAKSIEEYSAVSKSNPKDGVARYYIGLAFRNQAADVSKATVDAIDALNAAKKAKAPQPEIDELDAKRLGLQEEFQKKRDTALDELAAAVAIGGPVTAQARDALEKLYTSKNDSLQGLDQLIAQKKALIGL
ncbi:MAG: hypothetical protein HY646_16190 [Acidobacteria bacterium]|nr:hypothetical protein [Acidobacteriota bacterium]